MTSSVDLLTPYNFHSWKGDMEIQLHSKGLYRVTMDTEDEPGSAIENQYSWTRRMKHSDSCASLFPKIFFSIFRDWRLQRKFGTNLETLYGEQDDLRVYHLENELMSLQSSNFDTLNDFFTKFKHTILLLKQCKVEKVNDQLILAILSKLGADYLVFVSTFCAGKPTTPGWKMPNSMPSLSP